MNQDPDFKRLLDHPTVDRLAIGVGRVDRLAGYLERLWSRNRDINLFSRKLTPAQLVLDHLLDCLIGLPYLPPAGTIADLGSGGGLPALPLAICRPDDRFLLFEKSPLKRRFLASFEDLCPNIRVSGLLEPDGLPADTELIVARAFKPLPEIVRLTRAYFESGGAYALYKGRLAKIQDEIRRSSINPKRVRIERLDPPGNADERHLVLL